MSTDNVPWKISMIYFRVTLDSRPTWKKYITETINSANKNLSALFTRLYKKNISPKIYKTKIITLKNTKFSKYKHPK